MSLPRLFVGSSQKNLRVAQFLSIGLKDVAQVTVWNEGAFGVGYGFLEKLLKMLEDYEFAAFILAPDDVITTGDESRLAPRDNVLFESGLFMGVLGRDRVFLVHDESVRLKIPSDLAGVTLASYDGERVKGSEAASAVSEAALLIGDRIKESRFPHLLGEWKSEYPMTFVKGNPTVTEVLSVRTSGDCLTFATRSSSHADYYTGSGRVAAEGQILGKWKSREGTNDMEGLFMLTVSPDATFMYGYFTSPDRKRGLVYASWILAKVSGADEAEVEARLAEAREMLKESTVIGPDLPPAGR